MKNNQNNLRKSRFWKNIVGVLLLLLALAAYAATFTFSPNPDGTIYNLSEDTLFFYDFVLISFLTNFKYINII